MEMINFTAYVPENMVLSYYGKFDKQPYYLVVTKDGISQRGKQLSKEELKEFELKFGFFIVNKNEHIEFYYYVAKDMENKDSDYIVNSYLGLFLNSGLLHKKSLKDKILRHFNKEKTCHKKGFQTVAQEKYLKNNSISFPFRNCIS